MVGLLRLLVILCVCGSAFVQAAPFKFNMKGKQKENVTALPSLDWNLIQTHLMFSYSAYCDVGLQNWTCYWCQQCDTSVSDVYIISNTSTNIYGYAGVFNQSILISFRGTQLSSLKK